MEKRTNEVNDGFLQHTFDHTGASCDDFFFLIVCGQCWRRKEKYERTLS